MSTKKAAPKPAANQSATTAQNQKTPQEVLKELGENADNAAKETIKLQNEIAELQIKLLAAQQKQIATLQQYTSAERQYMSLVIQSQKKRIDELSPPATLQPIEEVSNESGVEEMN